MFKQKMVSRKVFLKILTGFGTGFFLWLWYQTGKQQSLKESQDEFRHGEDIPLGVSYFGKYYLYRTADEVSAFSTICTHAGCRIGKTETEVVQCGCHGSRFEAATGRAMNGPAIHPLKKLDCRYDSVRHEWVVKMYTSLK